MQNIRSTFGYLWAVSALVVALATFLGNDYLSRKLAASTGITVSPRYSGGEVIQSVRHVSYETAIHRPVFDALIGESKTGFVQVDWKPAKGLPPAIREAIDYTGDGKMDFVIDLDTATGKAKLTASNPDVLPGPATYRLRDGWAARIQLQRHDGR